MLRSGHAGGWKVLAELHEEHHERAIERATAAETEEEFLQHTVAAVLNMDRANELRERLAEEEKEKPKPKKKKR